MCRMQLHVSHAAGPVRTRRVRRRPTRRAITFVPARRSTPVSNGNRNPLRPAATPVSAVARPTCWFGNRSPTAANMLAERRLHFPRKVHCGYATESDRDSQGSAPVLARDTRIALPGTRKAKPRGNQSDSPDRPNDVFAIKGNCPRFSRRHVIQPAEPYRDFFQ